MHPCVRPPRPRPEGWRPDPAGRSPTRCGAGARTTRPDGSSAGGGSGGGCGGRYGTAGLGVAGTRGVAECTTRRGRPGRPKTRANVCRCARMSARRRLSRPPLRWSGHEAIGQATLAPCVARSVDRPPPGVAHGGGRRGEVRRHRLRAAQREAGRPFRPVDEGQKACEASGRALGAQPGQGAGATVNTISRAVKVECSPIWPVGDGPELAGEARLDAEQGEGVLGHGRSPLTAPACRGGRGRVWPRG